jgi:hypothetical protein
MLLLGVVQAQAAGDVSFGSYDLLATEILTTTATTITFSGLSTYAADYQHLQLRYIARGTTAQNAPVLRFNGVTSFSSYRGHLLQGDGSSVSSAALQNSDRQGMQISTIAKSTDAANEFGGAVLDILDPFETTKNTTIRSLGGTSYLLQFFSGVYLSTDALTSLTMSFFAEAGTYGIGSRFSLYGLRK